MIKATPETPAPRSALALLLIGPPGGGKTTLAMQFPNVWLGDIDQNTNGPVGLLRKINPKLSYFTDRIAYKDDGTLVPMNEQFERLKTCSYAAAVNPEVSTLIIDGLTHLDEILRHKCMKDARKEDMDISLWGPFRRELNTYIMKMRGFGKTLIMLCHEEDVERPVSAKSPERELVRRKPLVSSKITDAFGGYFTDVFRCSALPGVAGQTKYKIEINKTAYDDLKNSYGLAGEITIDYGQPAFAKVNQFLKL